MPEKRRGGGLYAASSVALTMLGILMMAYALLSIAGYKLQAATYPDEAAFRVGPAKAFYDYAGGGYTDEAGYGLQIGHLSITCIKVIAASHGRLP